MVGALLYSSSTPGAQTFIGRQEGDEPQASVPPLSVFARFNRGQLGIASSGPFGRGGRAAFYASNSVRDQCRGRSHTPDLRVSLFLVG